MAQPLQTYNALQRVTAPTTAPITLSEVKAQLRVEGPDDDVLLMRLINVATAYTDAKGALGQAMITQTWAQWMGPNPTQSIRLMLGPVQSISAVKYYDHTMVPCRPTWLATIRFSAQTLQRQSSQSQAKAGPLRKTARTLSPLSTSLATATQIPTFLTQLDTR